MKFTNLKICELIFFIKDVFSWNCIDINYITRFSQLRKFFFKIDIDQQIDIDQHCYKNSILKLPSMYKYIV